MKEIYMKDFLGKDLEIDNEVALTAPGYRMLTKAKIIAFTPKKVRVSYLNDWNFHTKGNMEEYLSEPNFLIKIDH